MIILPNILAAVSCAGSGWFCGHVAITTGKPWLWWLVAGNAVFLVLNIAIVISRLAGAK